MEFSAFDLDLPNGWHCEAAVERAADGEFSAVATLLRERTERCKLVVTQQPSELAAFERMKTRARDFISEWEHRQKALASTSI